MQYRIVNLVILFPLALAATGCRTTSHRVPCESIPVGVQSFVFAADGAGDFQDASENLKKVIRKDGLPMYAETVEWSHGYLRMVADQTDYEHSIVEGKKLAHQLVEVRRKHPHARINLMGHSAGCIVVVKALEFSPPGTVDRLVMLAPSLSSEYDLRPALANVGDSVDVFVSKGDWVYMKLYMRIVGTSDRLRTTGAGYNGFKAMSNDPADAGLYARLRQYPWRPADRWLGNQGGHFGVHQPRFLRARVVPLFLR